MFPDRRDVTFGNDCPEAWERISEAESGQFTNREGLFTFATFHPLEEAWRSSTGSSEAFAPSAAQLPGAAIAWKVVVHVPSEILRSMAWQVGRWFILGVSALLALTALASGLYAKVKSLQRFIPICARCKDIRNDDGSWERIESFFRRRSDAEFSHGICPDCSRILYPELED